MNLLLMCEQMRINPFTVMVIREGEEIIRTLPVHLRHDTIMLHIFAENINQFIICMADFTEAHRIIEEGAVLIVLRTIWTATYYDLIYMITGGGPVGSTTHLPILIYSTSFGSFQLGAASAISMVLGVLMFICIVFYLRTGAADE